MISVQHIKILFHLFITYQENKIFFFFWMIFYEPK